MQMIVDWIFTFLDMISLTFCSAYLVFLLPRMKESAGNKKILRVVKGMAWMIYTLLAVMIPMIWRNDSITMLGLTVYYILVGYVLYHRDKVGILYQVGFMFSLYATQVISIFTAVMVREVYALENRTSAYIMILLKACLLVMVTFVFRVLVRKRYMSVQPRFQIRGMLLVPVISMILIFGFAISSDVFLMRFGYGWLIVYCALILVMNLYCFYFWYDVSKTQELKHKLELMRQQSELTHQFYADLESNYAKSRKVIHDIRNHLQMLEQSQKFAESQSYVADMHQMLNALGMTYYTDNRMLNIILNDKLKHLNQEQFQCSLMGVRLDFLSEMDTTTIFANLLDNALEERRESENFRLQLQGEQIQDFCVIKMSNTTKGTYTPGKSSKTGHEGIGLENVRNAVGKYHGEMQTDQKGDVFSVTLLFPDDN
ncbi:MAG: GHKL domain-containing protein [Lachnospiraceae bacterium]|nr:GHKL domain-containing protein [Lachnospiraceae bacterium]